VVAFVEFDVWGCFVLGHNIYLAWRRHRLTISSTSMSSAPSFHLL
jgi:hypothetical protein